MINWANTLVAVTGGNGFLGKCVVRQLLAKNANVVVPEYDLRESRNAGRLCFEYRPDIIIHLAASVGGIGANIEKPGSFFYDNVKMGVELMEAARRYGVSKFVQMGSACEYPRDAEMPLKEEDVWDGYPETSNAAYGVAKRALLTMGQAYRDQYKMNVIHLLSTNLYGPGDNFGENSHFIPAAIRKFSEFREGDDTIELWGSGNATRDFLYVEDAAEAIVLATEHYNSREVAQKIAWLSGYEGKIVWNKSRPDGQPRRVLDTSKALQFGWEASTLLEAGLSRTISWYNAKSRSAR
jgi:GDP-L-fucose synthase